jgi:competence protein ComEC
MLIQWLEFIGVNYSGDVYLSSKNLTAPIMMMTALASFICLLPSGFPGRLLGFMGFLPFYFGGVSLSSKIEPLLELRVLDVGQGLAVHINVQGAHVLYDTGAYFSARFDIGTHVLLPYLETQNVESLEALIISHEDNDHVGGMSALVKRLPVKKIYRSYTSTEGSDESHMNCHQAKPWRLGGAVFEFLHVSHSARLEGNNRSCVLLIQVGPHSILLPGDLEREGEFALLAEQTALQSPISLMLAPHHGSQTSSSYAWLYYWRPKRIALSAGFENAYGHPHADVLKRYELLGAELLATGEEGALSYQFYPRSHPLHVTNQRQRALKSRYWYREYPALFSD